MKLNEVYNENCLCTMAKMSNDFVDLVVTSPPYDHLRDYKDGVGDAWNFFTFKCIAHELYRIIKIGGVCVWVVGDETKNFCESLSSFKQAIYFVKRCGFNLLDTMIYEKNGGPSPYPNMRRYAPWFEYMFVFSKGKPRTFNPIKDILTKSGEGKKSTGNTARQKDGTTKKVRDFVTKKYRSRSNIWKYTPGFNHDTKDKIALKHPARFPEALVKDHIISWSNPGDVVYDPFIGSGTTAKMAMLNNRKYIGSEISKEYFEIARERLKDYETKRSN